MVFVLGLLAIALVDVRIAAIGAGIKETMTIQEVQGKKKGALAVLDRLRKQIRSGAISVKRYEMTQSVAECNSLLHDEAVFSTCVQLSIGFVSNPKKKKCK